jgi:uncharacterized membrane protein YbhN (UPF0104 family)
MISRPGLRKGFLRLVAMAVFGCGSLWIMKKLGLLDLRPILEAFRREWLWIGLVILSLLGLLIFSAIRFFLLVRVFEVAAPFRNVLAANLVGQAVGQWLPGSMAVTEVLRFGVMAGLVSETDPNPGRSGLGPKARLGLAIFIDRLLGIGAMFAVGGLAGFSLLLRQGGGGGSFTVIFILSSISMILGVFAMATPFRSNRLWRRLATRAAGKKSDQTKGETDPAPGLRGLFRRTARKGLHLFEALEETRLRGYRAAAPLFLSLSASLLNAFTLYFASLAAGRPLPFTVILAAIPLTVAAVFLPAGIAGFGGPQLLAAGVFSLFGADPKTVVAACLLQNTIVLTVQTLGGGLGGVLLTEHFTSRSKKSRKISSNAGG